MRLTKVHQWVALTAAITSIPAQAQQQEEDPSPLEVIVVTSNHVPVPLRKIATSISVITAEDIEAHGNLSLVDVLRQLPSIGTSGSGGAGKSTSLRIRGEEGFRTLTIFDGIRLSDPSGPQVGPQLEHLLSSGIGRVEVLRGPQGLSYGADAGGILNITSRQAEPGKQINLDAQTGAFGTQQYSVNAGGANDFGDVFVSLAEFETDGFNTQVADNVLNDDDGYENTTVHLRGGINITDTIHADLVHRKVDGESQFDGCFLTGTGTIHDCDGVFEMTATRGSLNYTGANFSHAISYATTETDRDNISAGVSTFASYGELNRWEYVGSATNLPGFDLVFGGDLEEAFLNDKGRDNTGLYLEILSDFSNNLFLTAGVRHDDNDDFGTNVSKRFSAAYLIDMADSSTLKFKTSYGSGFRAPSPYEIQYNTSSSASPPASDVILQQETSEGYEAGIEYLRGSDLRLEATYFDQDVEDAIEFDLVAFSGYLQNVGVSNSKGVELSGEYRLNDNWNLTANYTHNETEQPNGLPRRRRPEELTNLGVSYVGLNERLNLNAFYRISRDSFDQSGSTLIALDDFEVLDLSGSFSITDNVQVYGRVENVTDEDYQEIIGYNTAERAAYIGIKLNFAGF
jgi:vitamin B12 transporter